MQRALRYDGLLPAVLGEEGKVRMRPATPAEIGEMKAFVDQNRAETTPFDIVVEGETPGDDWQQARDLVSPYEEAGATWWIEARWSAPDLEQVRTRLRQGPPRSR